MTTSDRAGDNLTSAEVEGNFRAISLHLARLELRRAIGRLAAARVAEGKPQ